jgi:hypothetical protein
MVWYLPNAIDKLFLAAKIINRIRVRYRLIALGGREPISCVQVLLNAHSSHSGGIELKIMQAANPN